MARKPRTGLTGLLLRQAGSARGASILVVTIVLVVSGLLAAWPRAVDHMFSAELQHDIGNVSPNLRNLQVTTTGKALTVGPSSDRHRYGWSAATDAVWGATADEFAKIRRSAPAPLRGLLGTPTYVASTTPFTVVRSGLHADIDTQFNADPTFRHRAHLAGGHWPQAYAGTGAVQSVVSATTARKLDWKIGQRRSVDVQHMFGTKRTPVLLTGVFKADDPHADYWSTYTGKLYPEVREPADGPKTITAAAYVNPADLGTLATITNQLSLDASIPLTAGAMQISNADTIAAQLRSFTAKSFSRADSGSNLYPTVRTLNVQVVPDIDAVVAHAASTNKILAMLASAPIGVAIAVLALASEMFIDRRRNALTLMAARGAGGLQRRGPVALEGLALGVPAAAVSVGCAYFLISAHTTVTSLLLPFLVGVLPGAFFAWMANTGTLRRHRADLRIGSRSRIRWIAEVVVLVATAVAVYLVSQQGVSGNAAVGVDPVVAVTPLLLALSVCVVTLRLYPFPMLLVTGGLARGRGLIGFLGSARSVRESRAGFIPALVLIVGFGTAALSGIVLSTVRDGITEAAHQQVGADVQVNGPFFDAEKLQAVQKLSDVKAAATVSDQGLVPASTPGGSADDGDNVRLLVTDLGTLATVQRSVPGGIHVPASAANGTSRPIPVIAGTGVDTKQTKLSLNLEHSAVVNYVRVQPHAFGIVGDNNWILMDAKAFGKVTGRHELFPTKLLVAAKPGVSARSTARQLRTVLGSDATYATPASEAASINAQPSTRGLQIGLESALILSAALSAAALAMTLIVGAPARERLVAILRSYGVSKRQSSMLVLWEIGPIIVAAAIAGAGLGWLLPRLVTSVVDFRPFTNGVAEPALAVDPLIMSGAFAGFIVVVAIGVIMAIRIAGRVSPAAVLRFYEEG